MNLRSLVDSLNTQARLLALLLFVCMPLSALLIYNAMDRYRLLKAQEEQEVLQMALVVAANQGAVITRTHQLLAALATDEDIQHRDWAKCREMLTQFFSVFKESYSVFLVADATGKVVCSSIEYKGMVNIGDRKDFKDVMSSRRFVAGDLVRSRTTGLMGVLMREPVVDGDRNVVAVLSALVSVDQFKQALLPTDLPDLGELVITERNDNIVLRKPAGGSWVGRHLADGPLSSALHSRTEGVLEAAGADGVQRVYGFARVGNGESGMHVAVGFPVAMIKDNITRNLYQNILILLSLVLLILGVAWYAVDALVLRKVKILVYTLDRVRAKEASARTTSTPGENDESIPAHLIDEAAADIERTLNLLREDSIRDPLTSLYNRRYLAEVLSRDVVMAQRKGGALAVITADIDHFKRINDTFGHEVGDQVLVSIARIIVRHTRGVDVACRVGGEEFTIVMPGASLPAAHARAEQIREAIAQSDFEHNGKHVGSVTISLGVSHFPDNGSDAESLLRGADQALYQAKRTGRNRTATLSEFPTDSPVK